MLTRFWNAIICLFLSGLLCAPVMADGKAFTVAAIQPTMPDQRAMIVFDGSSETLLIDTTIEGASGDTAWVVPVPAEPEVFEVDRGLFPTLQVVMQPRVLHRRSASVSAPALFFVSCACVLAAALRGSGRRVGCVLAIGLSGFFLVVAMLPTLGTARATPRGPAGIAVGGPPLVAVERAQVGSYETAVLQGVQAGGVLAWLQAEGFQLDAASRSAIDAYEREGWWFVASKLRASGDAAGTALSPHPLGLRFAASAPVYPMRLTGTQATDLAVDLFVFGTTSFDAPDFSLRRCGHLDLLEPAQRDSPGVRLPGRRHRFPGEEVAIGHAQLRELVGGATTVTWLSAELSPEQMGRDVALAPKAAQLRGNTAVSSSYALDRASTVWASCLSVGAVVLLAVWRPGASGAVVAGVALVCVVAAPLAIAGTTLALSPGIGVRFTTSPVYNEMNHWELSHEASFCLVDYEEGLGPDGRLPSPEDMEAHLRESLPELAAESFGHEPGEWQNDILGVPMREAAEPGGYRIWHDESGVWYAFYDLAGQEQAVAVWFPPRSTQIPAGTGG